MPFSYAELEQFYERLVARARTRGIACAITSGMACVAFGASEATKDCDLLCSPDSAGELLDLLGEATLGGQLPHYRGNLSAPLDRRWFPKRAKRWLKSSNLAPWRGCQMSGNTLD
jgi:hypothetical protein